MTPPHDARRKAFDLLLAGGMAFLAGATDVYGLARLGDLFVSFMSGNTTSLGVAVAHAEAGRVAMIGELIGLFVVGAAAGAALDEIAGKRHTAPVAFTVAGLVAVPLVAPAWTVAMLTLAMGMLNAAMSRVGQAAVSLTYVTGTLVKLGQGVGRLLCGNAGGWTWLWQLPMWLSLLAGSVSAALVKGAFGDTIWPLPALAALLACGGLARARLAPSTGRPGDQTRPARASTASNST